MQHKNDDALALVGSQILALVTKFSSNEKMQLNNWFEEYKTKCFDKAKKNTSPSNLKDISETNLSGLLEFIQQSNNLSNCNYKDLALFSRTSTMLSFNQQLTIALISAALNNQVKLLGEHANLFFNPSSSLSQVLHKAFPEITIPDKKPPLHPGKASYLYHFKPKQPSTTEIEIPPIKFTPKK